MDRMDEVRSFIKDNIDYDGLLQCHPTEKMDINELVELMVETIIFHLLFLFEFVGFYNNNHQVSLKQRKQELFMRKN